ncbi:MAG: DUF6603 domain-containing protein [Acidimicrobiia bacterium]
MSDAATNVLKALIGELEAFFEPLTTAMQSRHGRARMFATMGWDGGVLVDGAVEDAVEALQQILETVMDLADGELSDLGVLLDAIEAIGDLITAIDTLGRAAANGTLAALLDPTVLGELAEDLLAYLACTYLARRYPVAYIGAVLLTLVDPAAPERSRLALPSGQVVRRPVKRQALRFDHIPKLFEDPVGHLKAFHFNGAVDAAGVTYFSDRVLDEIAQVLMDHGIEASYGFPTELATALGVDPGTPFVERLLSLLFRFPATDVGAGVEVGGELAISSGLLGSDEGGPALVLLPSGEIEVSRTFADWVVELVLGGTTGGVAFGPGGVTFGSGSTPSGRIELGVSKGGGSTAPAFVIGPSDGSRVELGTVRARAGVDLAASGAAFDLEVGVMSAQIVVAAGDGDGFLQKVLPPDGFRVPFELGVGFKSPDRLYFFGGAGLEIELPVDIDLFGVIKIPVIGLRAVVTLPAGQPPRVETAVTADVEVAIGPFYATVEGMGISADLSFPPGGGNLGPVQLDFGFEPPRGIGMSIKAGPVDGGGYLFLDFDAGEYAGVLQVKVGPVGVTAIGLLNTKLPDGSDGFSLMLIICADFPTIQLGYGFTLNGAGGVLGINRTVNVPALQDGVRRGALDSILFPKDAVQNARRIISDVGTIYPPMVGQFVVGPMVKIGWGVFVTASIGVIIEFPRFTISLLGLIQIGLPALDAPVVLLRLAVAGIVDPGRGELSIDATLHGSFVTVFTISGDVAMRLRWKDDPMFALAAGGFHPRFDPPASFPQLERLTIALADSDNPRIRLESYMAVTPATVQFGARLEAYAALDLGVIGFFEVEAGMGFDTLIRFSPFSFEVDIYGYAHLKRNREVLFGVDVALRLSGPSPWRAKGVATVHFFGEHKVEFEVTSGQPAHEPPPPAIDVAGLVRAALGDPQAWASLPPTDAPVRLREVPVDPGAPAPARLMVHPAATLTARQSAAPLDRDLHKVGEAPISGPKRITLDHVLVGPDNAAATLAVGDKVTDHFAPSQFFRLSDDQRLTGPSFEPLPSGAQVGGTAAAWGPSATLADEVEDIVVDADERRVSVVAMLPVFALVASSALDRHRKLASKGRGVLGVSLTSAQYAVAGEQAAGGALVAEGPVFATWIDATLAGGVHALVVPAAEAAP